MGTAQSAPALPPLALATPLARIQSTLRAYLAFPCPWPLGDARRARICADIARRVPDLSPDMLSDAQLDAVLLAVVREYDANVFGGALRELDGTPSQLGGVSHAILFYLPSFDAATGQLVRGCVHYSSAQHVADQFRLVRDHVLEVLGPQVAASDRDALRAQTDFALWCVYVCEHELTHSLIMKAQADMDVAVARARPSHDAHFFRVLAAVCGQDVPTYYAWRTLAVGSAPSSPNPATAARAAATTALLPITLLAGWPKATRMAHLWLAAAVCGDLRWRGRAVTIRVAQLPNFSAYIQMSFLPSNPSSFLDRPTSFGSAVPLKLRSNPPTSPNLRNPRTSQTSPSGRTASSPFMQSCRGTTPRPRSSKRAPTRRRPTSSRLHAMTRQKRF
jgi:hypothetical protein